MVKRWFILILSQCHIIKAAAFLGFLFSSPCHLACPQSTRSRRCNSTSTINRQNTPFFFTSSYLVPGQIALILSLRLKIEARREMGMPTMPRSIDRVGNTNLPKQRKPLARDPAPYNSHITADHREFSSSITLKETTGQAVAEELLGKIAFDYSKELSLKTRPRMKSRHFKAKHAVTRSNGPQGYWACQSVHSNQL
ncbi:hypothetical protein D5086_004466 [Populus alba]|uniref:Uncharacterized protein n=1 Tax=Populus alba TaxID=43335 RepID=A0ACC4CQV4_POPAL